MPIPTPRPERKAGVGQKNGGFSGGHSRSPSTLAEVNSSLWEGYQDFIEAVKGQECQIQKEKQAMLGAGHQGHLHWYQSTALGSRRPKQVSALVPFCPGLEVPKERARLKLPAAGWRKTGLSVMVPQRQLTSQKRFRKPKTQQEEGSVGSRQKRCPAQHLSTSSAFSKPAGAGGDRAAQHLPPESTAHAQSDPPAAAQLRPSEAPGSLKGTELGAPLLSQPLFLSRVPGRWFAKCSWARQVLKGWGRGPPPGLSSTEVQAVADGAGPGAASGALRPGAPAPASGQARAPTPVPAAASQFTLLVMRPCGGPDEAAAEGVLRQAPALGGSAGAGKPVRYLCEVAGDGEEEAGEDETDLLDTSDPPGGGESTASLEDLEDEETHSGGEGGSGGARRRGSGGGSMSKTCTYEGCSETTSQVAKQRKPWMCKKHRNKMYKDKYKKKKSDQALNCGGAAQAGSAGNVKLEESADNILSIVKQRTGSFGDRPARPTLLEQVLNQKRLSLLRSPEVVQFLQKQQQLLNQQVLEQRQQQFPGTSV
ncbi:regulatory factor X-associated protein [Lagenorhynchus albirostris]|uniref:regulatory factor X-associated protein n=1 Tax=Lagenorhynchus albirostris TaxID=27610 RepID=UPI0028E27C6C|nr:regulatory factor X-associated protein [Lagenorhynchus albirostris]